MLSRRNGRMGLYAAAVLAGAGLMANAGDLDPPPGPVGPTMVTLDEIDGKLDQILADLGARSADAAARGSSARIYMRSQNIGGDTDEFGYVDWIRIDTAGISMSGPEIVPGGPGVGRRTLEDLQISGTADSGLTQLMTSQTMSRALINLEIEWVVLTPSGPRDFLRMEMNECFVSNTVITLDSDTMEPRYTMSIAPSDVVVMRYTQYDGNGNVVSVFVDNYTVQ